MTGRPLEQIDKIVVLMLENRSLDNVLGWLYDADAHVHIWPPGSQPRHFDGIPADAVNHRYGTSWAPSRGAPLAGDQRWRMPRWDPNESMEFVQKQMYGDRTGYIADRTWGDDQTMRGFAVDYPTTDGLSVGEVMGAYTPEELPVLSGLARSFAVSDRWFGSVPSETDPNRAFSLCGTCEGIELATQNHVFTSPTLFNALNTSDGSVDPKTWCVYSQVEGFWSTGPIGSITYTQGRFAELVPAIDGSDGRGAMGSYDLLLALLRNGDDIPDLCYIEPAWGWGYGNVDGTDYVGYQGNDYHPPTWVGPAEWDLNELYVALRRSPHWDRMLFVILFDEHGGCYDHVSTPTAVRPDGFVGHPTNFLFDRFGPRVPAILVSPFVQPGTVFRAPLDSVAPFDHTSLLKTITRWAGCDPNFTKRFGKRFAAAPSFEDVLSPDLVQLHAPDGFDPPESFRDQCPKGPHHLGWLGDAAWLLSRDDHATASAGAATIEEYIAILRRIVEERTEPAAE